MEMATLITIKNNTDVHYQSSTIENIQKTKKQPGQVTFFRCNYNTKSKKNSKPYSTI